MKKANIFIWIAIGVIVIISGWLIFFNRTEEPLTGREAFQEEEEIKEEVILIIDDGAKDPKSLKAEFVQGMTVFDLLDIKTKELDLTLKTKLYDIGIFIEAIGDKENGQDGKYWLYYVNGEMPMVSADNREIGPGDKVEFKFEESSF